MSVRNSIIEECKEKVASKFKERGLKTGLADFGMADAARQVLENLKLRETKISDFIVDSAIRSYEEQKRKYGPYKAMKNVLNFIINKTN